jgi:hypothetical protein
MLALASTRLGCRERLKNIKYYFDHLDIKAGVNSAEITNIAKQLIKVFIPNPSHGCSAYTSVSTTEELVPVYYLVSGDEGECSYGRKAELAKKAFGSGVIIIDSP